ncbi:hypothetical protein BO70DRAFT_357945 [Aspergillus heteromorphus CBS 117.55]|uniref:Uncharacterized protein n=1 Tax=Aspergillus heteromorphus CBS 117.55 TaxID=1448321 RepID=A0A317X7F6_9EURO|nr:uncharacterized protein BO70DRAFT_357945 [Aspergillus heteromorphus CBS 117.55]PWY92808.1 hypothetical protein BO70DRAFT_357945 [Aspergillus heteromorphus CBS 117.55]
MPYRTNYEPYTSQSFDMKRELSTEEILYPLGSLYPHVVALQLQANEYPWCKASQSSGYHDSSYWAEVETPEHLSTKSTARRYSDSTTSRFVSRIRRFLSRDELRRRARHA